ncbi:MAG: porin [Fimbriimonas sp.]
MRSVLFAGLSLLAVSAFASDGVDQKEVQRLRAAAEAKTKEIGKLAESGQLPTNDEALKLLQQMVQELGEIRERLKRLESNALTPSQVAATKVLWGGYVQFQYQDTDRKGASQFDAFRFRRVRIGFNDQVDPRLNLRVSFDLATGTNQMQAQLRDAWGVYDFSGGSKLGRDRVWAGQMPIQLGYELDRSSADREVPERSQYNQILFNTERSRGVRIRHEGKTGRLEAAVVDALSVNDPEQANLSSGPGNKLATVVGARLNHKNGSIGVSGMAGDRPAYTANSATSPEVPRRFAYLDADYKGFLTPRLTLRGELMTGRDRVPNATADPGRDDHDMAGYHLMGVYQLSSLDQFAVRWEHFDPNTSAGGNALHGIAASYVRNLTPHSKIMLAHEVFVDQARSSQGQTRYEVTTLRLQVRF